MAAKMTKVHAELQQRQRQRIDDILVGLLVGEGHDCAQAQTWKPLWIENLQDNGEQ